MNDMMLKSRLEQRIALHNLWKLQSYDFIILALSMS